MIVIKNVGEKMKEAELQEDSLAQFQEIVGGYVDVVRLPLGIDLWCDDEALIKNNPTPNFIVSRGALYDLQFIFGNVAFASTDNEGNTIPLNHDQKTYIEKRLQPFTTGSIELNVHVLDISH